MAATISSVDQLGLGSQTVRIATYFGTFLCWDRKDEALIHDRNFTAHAPVVGRIQDNEIVIYRILGNNPIYDLVGMEVPKERLKRISNNCPLLKMDNGSIAIQIGANYLCAHPDGRVSESSLEIKEWESFQIVETFKPQSVVWRPFAPSGGTQLMERELKARVGAELEKVHLVINRAASSDSDNKPIIAWIHNEVSANYNWCEDASLTDQVAAFVFVSEWQRQAFIDRYRLPASRSLVIRNAVVIDCQSQRRTLSSMPWRVRCAYVSAPYRGLDVLLDGWELLSPLEAELHIWSSKRLWGDQWEDSDYDETLFKKARSLHNVFYHGIASNTTIRRALSEFDILTYPCTFQETSCLAIIEAMAAGMRIVSSSIAVIPETTAGFGQLYPYNSDRAEHARVFASALSEELASPWGGNPRLRSAQEAYVSALYSWDGRVNEWLKLIARLV